MRCTDGPIPKSQPWLFEDIIDRRVPFRTTPWKKTAKCHASLLSFCSVWFQSPIGTLRYLRPSISYDKFPTCRSRQSNGRLGLPTYWEPPVESNPERTSNAVTSLIGPQRQKKKKRIPVEIPIQEPRSFSASTTGRRPTIFLENNVGRAKIIRTQRKSLNIYLIPQSGKSHYFRNLCRRVSLK